MSEFEFLAVFVSIVLGLGVTHVLHGVARIIHDRDRIQIAPLHLVWTVNVLLILLLNWWVLFLWADFSMWSFDLYLLLILWGISLYMLAVVLYPPDIRGDESYFDLFERNRKWLFGTFIVFLLLDIAQTAVRGQLFDPPIFLPYVLHYAVLSGLGIFLDNKRFQAFFAWYVLLSLVLWSVVVRRILGG